MKTHIYIYGIYAYDKYVVYFSLSLSKLRSKLIKNGFKHVTY